MTQFDKRLAQLEQRSGATGHICEVIKCWPDGRREVISIFWTNHPVTRILGELPKP